MMFRPSTVLAIISLLALAGAGMAPAVQAHSLGSGHVRAGTRLSLIHPGYLTVGSDTTYPPMESTDPNHPGRYVGADVDLAAALARAMGLKSAIIVNNSFDSIIPALQRHKFDVIMSSMNDTPERRRVISFVDYMRASEGIVVKKSSSIRGDSYAAVCGHSISVERGTTELDGLNAANNRCKSKITIKTFTADTDAFQAFAAGHTEAYTGDLPVCALYVKQRPVLRLAGKPFGAGENYGIGLPKNATTLKAALQRALTKIRANGLYKQILTTWGVSGASF